jgi:signal recognition particle subunit SRP54
MKNMGGMASLMGKLPGMGQIPDNVKAQMDDKVLVRMEAIINSMTLKERAKPEIIKGSRKRRIAAGCGMQVQDVNRLLKQFDDMQRMMKKMKSKGGMMKMMRGMKGMMPPGFPGNTRQIQWLVCHFSPGCARRVRPYASPLRGAHACSNACAPATRII